MSVSDPPARLQRAGAWLFWGHLVTVFSIAASNILLGFMLLIAPWSLRGRREDWARAAPLLIPLAVYALWIFGSAFASFDPKASLEGLRELFTLAALLLAPGLVRGEAEVRRVVDGLVAAAALLACAGLLQVLWGYGDIDRRIRGPFSHYMTFSGFLLVCDLLLLTRLLGDPTGSRGRWGWRWAALASINVALLGSYTRGAWVALVVAVTVLVLVRAPKLILAYFPLGVLIVLLAPVPLVRRMISIGDLQDPSNYDRLCMLEAGLNMVAERPLFGLGPEMVERRYPIYRPPSAPRFDIPHLHNSFLQLAAERGLPALLAYLAMTAASLRFMLRQYRRERRDGRRGPRDDLYLGAMLAILAFNVAGLFENNWGDTEVQRTVLFLLILPFCLAAGENDRLPDHLTAAG